MRELSLREIQEYSLKVLLHVHDFCVTHNIQYSLAYGTLIGAVRHKGFIPWDDDVDIIMTRDNFERFLKEYQSDDEFKLVSPYDKNSYIAFARVCDMKDTVIETSHTWSSYQTGIWIDIFPVDHIDDDFQKHLARYKKLHRDWIDILRYRTTFYSYPNPIKKPYSIVTIFAKRRLWPNALEMLRQRMDDYLNEIKSRDYIHSSHCAQLALPDDFGYYDSADFDEYTTLEFEGHQLSVIKAYDKVLRQLYGDYMKFPSLGQMTPQQADYIHFYHKD